MDRYDIGQPLTPGITQVAEGGRSAWNGTAQQLHRAIRAQAVQPFDEATYHRTVDQLYATTSSQHLQQHAIVTCKAGD